MKLDLPINEPTFLPLFHLPSNSVMLFTYTCLHFFSKIKQAILLLEALLVLARIELTFFIVASMVSICAENSIENTGMF